MCQAAFDGNPMNRNKVLSLYEDQPIDDMGRGGNRVQVGEPIGIFYGYNCLGVDPTTGNLIYEDVNKDGTTRYDMTELSMTHFRPKEIGTPVKKLKELDLVFQNGKNQHQILFLGTQKLPVCT